MTLTHAFVGSNPARAVQGKDVKIITIAVKVGKGNGECCMASKELDEYLKSIETYKAKKKGKITEDLIKAYLYSEKQAFDEGELDLAFDLAKNVKNNLWKYLEETRQKNIWQLDQEASALKDSDALLEMYWNAVRFEAPYKVDSFFQYIERDIERSKRFYAPRMERLKPIINGYQEVYDGKLDFLSVSQPKRTGKTTSGLRLSLMMAGRKPDGCIFATGKGEGLVKSFFGGLNETFDNESMYKRYLEIFPTAKKVAQNAEELTIHLGEKRRFATFTCRPIDGSVVGNTEANVLLYLDDTVKNHEEARNRDRLEFLCEKVTDDILGRRIEGTPVIIQGTKYSLYDPISFLQAKADELEWNWKEVAIPALDPITDESNWEIEKDGKKIFTTDYYRRERKLVTEETWMAEFQQEPFEAKGRMFPADRLNYYVNLPIDKEPDTIISACDSADKGDDSCAMPIGYVYGNEVYIEDVVFDSSGAEYTKPECAKKLFNHNVKTVTFESNSAGEYFGRDVMDLLDEMGGRCSARFKYNTTNKITRMENACDNIIKYYYFKDPSCYDRNSQYGKFMRELTTMTRTGKVKHDDAPDSLALFENEMRNTPKEAQIRHGGIV